MVYVFFFCSISGFLAESLIYKTNIISGKEIDMKLLQQTQHKKIKMREFQKSDGNVMTTNYEVIMIFPFLPSLEHSKVGFRYQQSPKQFTKFWRIW